MKYFSSFDGILRADFLIQIRLSKKEVERIRYHLKRRGKRNLDIDIRRFVNEEASWVASEDLISVIEGLGKRSK